MESAELTIVGVAWRHSLHGREWAWSSLVAGWCRPTRSGDCALGLTPCLSWH